MAKKLHLVHVKSNVLDKAPSASTINYGEIAVNYNADSPALYIRDADDNIVKFIDEETVSAAINDLNDKKADKEYVDEAVSSITIDVDSELDSASTNPVENQAITKVILKDEKVVSFALNDLNNRKADSATFNTHTGTTVESRTSSQMHLPTVSASDNGKILSVVNGEWALVDPGTIY